jgi:hypothetical protein
MRKAHPKGKRRKARSQSHPLAVRQNRPPTGGLKLGQSSYNQLFGEVAERLNAPVLKTGKG